AHVPRAKVGDYLGRLRAACGEFAAVCRWLAGVHAEEAELVAGWEKLAVWSDEAAGRLGEFAGKYGSQDAPEPGKLRAVLFPGARPGPFGVLRDLHGLAVLAVEVATANVALTQAARALRDAEL